MEGAHEHEHADDVLERLLSRLPPDHRYVIRRVAHDGWSEQQVAEELDMTERCVLRMICEAKEMLTAGLDGHWEEELEDEEREDHPWQA
jgi:DNA-directed RNA polymerase specialized sigma24 family protein